MKISIFTNCTMIEGVCSSVKAMGTVYDIKRVSPVAILTAYACPTRKLPIVFHSWGMLNSRSNFSGNVPLVAIHQTTHLQLCPREGKKLAR